MYKSILVIMFIKLLLVIALTRRQDLYEGSPCTLEHDGVGVCKKISDCPMRLKEVEEGVRDSISTGRCGFDDFIEIVCCPSDIKQTLVQRPSEVACQEYTEIKLELRKRPVVVVHSGYDAEQGEFPFTVALGFPNQVTEDEPNPIKYNCGGTLISYEHVLTAAHCVSNIQELVPTVIHLGSVRLHDKSINAKKIPISKIIVHPQYKRSRSYNDIAILKMQEKIKFTQTIQPACLYLKPPIRIEALDWYQLIVAGWGATSTDVDKSLVLLRTPGLRMVNQTVCNPHYKHFAKLPNGIVDSLICIKDTDTGRNADGCNGDSGGPLILRTVDVQTIIGITAFGQHCGSSAPGVYTAIFPYLEWIEKQVWGNN